MSLLLSLGLCGFGLVVSRGLRTAHGGRRRARRRGLLPPALARRHSELRERLVRRAEMDDREGPELARRLPSILDDLLQLLGGDEPTPFMALLLDLELPRLGQERFEIRLQGIDPRQLGRVLRGGPEDGFPVPEDLRLCCDLRHDSFLSFGWPRSRSPDVVGEMEDVLGERSLALSPALRRHLLYNHFYDLRLPCMGRHWTTPF